LSKKIEVAEKSLAAYEKKSNMKLPEDVKIENNERIE